jgi:cell wall-associated NlpC family hydrolase
MAGRHRKPNTSTSAVTAAKIAVTGAVLGSSSLALTNQASAAADNEWDQVAHCESATWPVCGSTLSGPIPRNVSSGAVNDGQTPPLELPPPTDAPSPAPDQAEVMTAPPPQPVFAPVADAEADDSDVTPASDSQPFPAPAAVDDSAKETELVTLVRRYSGTPYIWGGDSPEGTDCSGLASWLANMATGRPVFGDRFDTSSEESALLARGFHYGTAPGALVIGWNDHHTAVTLADGTPVSSGEGGGIRIGGGGAYEAQFTHHMFLPIRPEGSEVDQAPADAPEVIEKMNSQMPVPQPPSDPAGSGDVAPM